MKRFEDEELIEYVIENGATLKQAAEHFGVTIDAIKYRMRKIKNNLANDSEILIHLKEIAKKNELEGKILGGKALAGGIPRTITLEEIAEKAMIMLSEDLTIDEAALSFGIASSTLHGYLRLLDNSEYVEIYNDLQSMYNYHNENRTMGIIPDVEKRNCSNTSTWLPPVKRRTDAGMERLKLKYSQKLEELRRRKK